MEGWNIEVWSKDASGVELSILELLELLVLLHFTLLV
jgi:hypothetical protein